MPRPRQGETEDEFVARCIPVVIEDGAAKDGAQAAAICHSLWRDRGNARLSALEHSLRRNARRERHG